MTKEEKMQLLETWAKESKQLTDQWEKFASITGALSDWPLGDAIWSIVESHTSAVARLLECDDSHLSWQCYDNEFGKQGLECEIDGETREIRTLSDLAWMIGLDG